MMSTLVTELSVRLEKRKDGNFDLYIGDYCQGQIYHKNGKYYASTSDVYDNRNGFSSADEAAMRFLKEKAFLDWTDEELET
jgi:hypothetical protein